MHLCGTATWAVPWLFPQPNWKLLEDKTPKHVQSLVEDRDRNAQTNACFKKPKSRNSGICTPVSITGLLTAGRRQRQPECPSAVNG